jgi:hypothetical protein
VLNLTHWRGALIRQRYLWCVRWCVFLTLSLGSVALSAWVMLSSLIQDLSQLDQMVSDSPFVVRSIDPGIHAVVAEVELSDG